MTDACLAVVYRASPYAEFGTDFGLSHAIHIAVQNSKFQRRELQGIHKSIIFRVIRFICVLATILRPLAFARSYANLSLPKEANPEALLQADNDAEIISCKK